MYRGWCKKQEDDEEQYLRGQYMQTVLPERILKAIKRFEDKIRKAYTLPSSL